MLSSLFPFGRVSSSTRDDSTCYLKFYSYGTYFYSVLLTVITCSSFYLLETLVLGNHACCFGSRLVFAFSCSFDEYCLICWISIDTDV